MKKRTSNLSRRIVSLLMSMVLTLTLVTPAAFATEVGTYVNGENTTVTAPAGIFTQEGEDTSVPVAQRTVTVKQYHANEAYEVKIVVGVEEGREKLDTTYAIDADTKTVTLKLTTADYAGEPVYIKTALDDVLVTEGENPTPALTTGEPTLEYTLPEDGDVTLYYGTQEDFNAPATQRTVTVEKYRTDAAYVVKIVVGVEEDGTTEKLDTTYTINADTKTVTLKLTTADYDGEPVYIKTALDDVLVTEDENQTPALTKDTPTLEYTLPEDGDVTLYYGTQEDFVSAWYTSVTDDKYTIRTAAELAYFAQLVNGGNDFAGGVVTLARDIDLSAVCGEQSENWIPIGNTNQATFRGTFDGQSHTVSEIYSNNDFSAFGLFGYVKNGEVTALTVSGTIIAKDRATIGGGIAGSLDGGIITKCTSNVVIEYPQQGSFQFYYGGIVGDIKNGSRVSLCENYGNIRVNGGTNGSVIGGIVGKVYDIDSKVENCKNNGAINAVITAQRMFDIGGIVGINAGTVTQCRNLGNLSLTNTAKKNRARKVAGGVVGKNETASSNGVINCSNDGVVTLNSSYPVDIISGIVADGGVANCYNWGDVKGSLTSSTYGVGKPENVTNSYYICKLNGADDVTMKYVHNNIEQPVTYEEATRSYKVGENTLVKTLNDNKSDGLSWFVNIPKGITKPIFVKLWDGTDHPDYVPDGTEKDVYVTYDPNGGNGGKTVAVTVTLNEDGTVKAPGSHTILTAEDAGVEKDSCELKDWNIEANGEGTTYTIGQDVSVSENMTLYAQWQLLWKGSGTESDPYQIENEEDWLKMQKHAKRYSNYPDMWFALMDDITLDNYEPFFFRGNLMGNGNTITVDVPESIETDKHTRGLFSSIIGGDAGIRIENLTIAGSVAAYRSAGGLAGNITGKVTLENVTSNVTVKAGGHQYDTTSSAGGLCGSYSRDTLTVKNCVNNGSVTAYQAAGFVANKSGSTTMSFSGCRNTGAITGKGAYGGGYAAGFVSIYDANSLTCTFENCANSGTISANARAAGIAINCRLAANCTNSGTINGNIAGGILESGAVKYSTNTGEINGEFCAAGIASTYNTGAHTVEFCANFGKVTVTAGSGAAKRAYGIASQGTIKNCFTYNNETHVPVAGNTTGRNCVVTNSYYLASSKDEFPSTMGGEYATLDDFASGKVAWGVDGSTGAHANYWTQGANNYPVPIGEGTSTSYYRAQVTCGTGGTATIKRGDGRTGDADNAVYGPSGTKVTVTATPKDSSYALKSLTLDLMSTGTTADLANPGSFALGAANAKVVATFASAGSGGGSGSGSGSGSGTGAGDESDEGLQDGVNMDVEYNVKGLVLSAYTEWGSNGGGKTFSQWLKDSPNVLRALIANSLDNMAAAAAAKKTDEASALAQALLASLNEHSGVTGKDGDAISKALQRFMTSGTEATFSTWLTTGSGMASGTVESIFTQYTDSLLALADRLYTKWESSGTSMTFPAWLDAQQVSMENLSETAEEPDTDTTDESQTTEAPEDVPDGQESEGQVSGNSIWEIIGTAVRENPIIVWSIVAVVAALVIVGAVRRYHKVKRDERDDNGAE